MINYIYQINPRTSAYTKKVYSFLQERIYVQRKATLLFLIALCSLLPAILYSQVDTAWVRLYNGPGNSADYANAIAIDDSGNIYATGWSWDSLTYYDYTTIKYNSAGETLWIRRYNGPGNGNDSVIAITVDDSGNVYITGCSYGIDTYVDYATIKYNSSGESLWVRRYNGPGNLDDVANSIAVDDSVNVYVTGFSWGSGTRYDYATIKYNSAGETLWIRRYDGQLNMDDVAKAIAVDSLANVYVTGQSFGLYTDDDYATIKYNSSGESLWVRRYNGPANIWDVPSSIAVDCLGNVYVTGSIYGSGTDKDYATIKYNSSGESLWVRRYNGPGNSGDVAKAIAVDNSGNVYVTGGSTGSGTSGDYGTIKYNSTGDTVWVRRYNNSGSSWDEAGAIAIDDSGNIYVTGYSSGSGTSYDFATIRYNSAGVVQWVARYNGPANNWDQANAIAVDGLGNVYVTGRSWGSGTGYDYATIKYVQTSGVKENHQSLLSAYKLESYPNPFKSQTTIRFSLLTESKVSLQVYYASGRLIRNLFNEKKKPGFFAVRWDGRNNNCRKVAHGIYFYRLEAGDFTAIKKMVKME